jgi:hypothetical protein
VIDWHWLQREMPISNDALSKRKRNLLFELIDDDANGFMHISEVLQWFLKNVRIVKGIFDLRPVWLSLFRLARAAVDPVIPIGSDFMERNQFRTYLICIWLYLRLWEYFYNAYPRGNVTVTVNDLPEVVNILEQFGYPDAERFETFIRPHFQDSDTEYTFSIFVEVCLKHVLTELSEWDSEAERSYALGRIGQLHPGLLQKGEEAGIYKANSFETGQARMTGFVYKKTKKSASEAMLHQPSVQPNGQAIAQQWRSEHSMQFTTSKFHPKARRDPYNHRCQTERCTLPFSHPYNQAMKPPASSDAAGPKGGPPLQRHDISRLVLPALKRSESGKPLQVAGITMAQKLQRLGVIQQQ